MIKKIVFGKVSSIANAAIVVALASFASRLLGVVRDHVLARQFGAGPALDIYYAAFRIPDLIYNLVIVGAIAAGFVPVLTGLIKSNEDASESETGTHLAPAQNEEAWKLTNNVITVFSVVLVLLSMVGFIWSKQLVKWISPGFTIQQVNITVIMTRIMFLSPVLMGISGIVSGTLQAFKRFLVFSLAPIMYNIGIIFGALFLTKPLDIYGLAWGVAIGAALHLGVQIPALYHLGFKFRWYWSLSDTNLREIFKLMIPRLFGLATAQFNLIITTIFGSLIASGSIAIFNLANNLQSLPVGLIGVSFAIAAFPTLSQFYSRQDFRGFNSTLNQTLRMILFVVLPVSFMLLVLKTEVVTIVLGAGQFTSNDVALTANALGAFVVSLFAQALIPLLARAFFARHDTIAPLVAGVVGAVANIFFAWLMAYRFGVVGLTLAFSFGAIVNFLVLAWWLKKKIGDLDEQKLIESLLKIIGASVVMGGAMMLSRMLLLRWWTVDTMWQGLKMGVVLAIIGAAVYLMVCVLAKSRELNYLRGRFKAKMAK
jgi:putative peptidoglycan lipid II flippase